MLKLIYDYFIEKISFNDEFKFKMSYACKCAFLTNLLLKFAESHY